MAEKISLENYIKLLKKVSKDIPKWAELKAELIASQDMTALIAERVQDTGKNAFGGSFKPYSTEYKKLRKKKGLETSFKDFTFTTEMWRSFGVISKKADKNRVIIKLGGRNRDGQIKINVNSKREGISIIGISKQEEKEVLDILDIELFKFLQQRI